MAMPPAFDLNRPDTYQQWRDAKLSGYPERASDLIVEIANPAVPSAAECSALRAGISKTNMAVFACRRPFDNRDTLRRFAAHFGLNTLDNHLCTDEDGISALQVSDQGHKQHYIPYTNRQINWHTDGYYNSAEHQIYGMALYCVHQAAEGGANRLLDHEMAYIALRDQDPELIRALSEPDAMAIPPNDVEGEVLRDITQGPVFSTHAGSGQLHMRYTARKRNIQWKNDATTQAAKQALETLMNGDQPPIFQLRLEAGQGVLCNNVLHFREAFRDNPALGPNRLYFRARYYDRIR